MNPIDKLITYAIGSIIAIVIFWWAGDSIMDSIRAPAIARAEAAEKSNATLVKAKNEAEAETLRLSTILEARGNREAENSKKLEGLSNAFSKLARQNKAVADWSNTAIPDAVIELRTIQDASALNPSGSKAMSDSVKFDAARAIAPTTGARRDERRIMEPEANLGNPAGSVQPTPGRCAGVATGVCGIYNRLAEKMK